MAPRSPRALVATLVFVGTVVAVISSLGAPLVPAVAAATGAALPDAQWSLTVTLLVGAVATPVVGRLGDGPHRRRVVLAVLAVVTLGGVLAALPLGLGWLVAGRALQGVGLGLTPLAIATAREALAGERSRATIAALSVTVVTGVGLGYPLAGLVAEAGGVGAAFWAGAAVSAAALAAAAAVLPAPAAAPRRRLDVVGAVLLGAGLGGLLLALGEAETWGPASPRLWALAAAALAALALWVAWELRTPEPLVDLRLARGRVALTAHSAALLVGLSNYLLLAAVPVIAQAPPAEGAGFGTSIVVAGLALLPFSAASVVGGRLARVVADRAGQARVLPLAALAQGAAFVLFALLRTDLWHLFAVMAVAGLGVGAAFAALPALVVAAVPPAETGSATSLNQVLRYVGFSVGSALTATVLAAATPAGGGSPAAGGYTVLAVAGVGVCLLTAVVTLLTGRPAPAGEAVAAR
ncbi:Major Facilitator Superfamily protein [Geodermatophilus dictyosporus]|uniref:Major Facilitator Superfamily protein n=1 Tax=Geodermatophilus dictyosporus TaxID=1523247 RepID=A0A1I5JI78_9ACTN|nr:MFS transporter [Geodermatophilus dictyosporus]SFO72475.1 Major Facilitator Superfamily protein [Geodermatophilus dictyosporus]